MAQNITLMGASYSDVPAVELPKTGGGTAQFTDVSDTTATASDVAQGKYFYTAAGARTAGTASGGGGASNVVTGTFKGTTTGTAMDITLPYTGNGYPIAVSIYPSDGYQSGSSAYDILQRYASIFFSGVKRSAVTPTYETSGGQNQMIFVLATKSSSTTASTLTTSAGQNTNIYSGTDAAAATTQNVKFKDNKKMSVFIASNSYGFMANIEYTYYIIYSS